MKKVVTTPKHAFIANDLCVMGTWYYSVLV